MLKMPPLTPLGARNNTPVRIVRPSCGACHAKPRMGGQDETLRDGSAHHGLRAKGLERGDRWVSDLGICGYPQWRRA